MTVILTLLSHGPTAATRRVSFASDEPLKAQLPPIAELWRGRLVLTSPARACVETAASLSLVARVDDGLADLDCGAWAGKAVADIAATDPRPLQQWLSDPDFVGHGGESRTRLRHRVAGFLDRMATQHGHILTITHAAVIRAAILSVLDAPDAAFWAIDIGPATTTELRHDGRRWALRAMGQPLAGQKISRASAAEDSNP